MHNIMGQRIRYLREKSGLSRSEFSLKFGISSSTLRAYEMGNKPLPETKQVFFRNIFKDLGFEIELPFTGSQNIGGNETALTINFDKNDLSIKREIDFFKKENPDYLLYTINNTFMYPILNIGDIIGGIKCSCEETYINFCGAICIVSDIDNEKFVGRIINVNKNTVFISPYNFTDASNLPFIEIKNVSSLTQVTRHWCLNNIIRL